MTLIGNGKRTHVQKAVFEKSFPTSAVSPIILVGFCVLDVLVDDDDHHLKLSTKNINHIGYPSVPSWLLVQTVELI